MQEIFLLNFFLFTFNNEHTKWQNYLIAQGSHTEHQLIHDSKEEKLYEGSNSGPVPYTLNSLVHQPALFTVINIPWANINHRSHIFQALSLQKQSHEGNTFKFNKQ